MKNLIYLSVFASIIVACSKDSTNDIKTPTTTPEKVVYGANVKPILDNNCISCHGTGGQTPLLTNFTDAKNNIGSIIDRIERTGSGVMPPSGRMSQATIDLIKKWQTDGLLEN